MLKYPVVHNASYMYLDYTICSPVPLPLSVSPHGSGYHDRIAECIRKSGPNSGAYLCHVPVRSAGTSDHLPHRYGTDGRQHCHRAHVMFQTSTLRSQKTVLTWLHVCVVVCSGAGGGASCLFYFLTNLEMWCCIMPLSCICLMCYKYSAICKELQLCSS